MNRVHAAVVSFILGLAIPCGTVLAKDESIVLAQAAPMADAEVRKIDKDAAKITLKHGPIPNLDMGAMTMVFRVKEPAMLDKVKQGDKIKFTAEKIGGQYTVTGMEKAP